MMNVKSTVAIAPSVVEQPTLEKHIVAERVRAFERAASKQGAAAPAAVSAVQRERSPPVAGL